MAQAHLQMVRLLRKQILAETSSPLTNWVVVQDLLDELMFHHEQYKIFAAHEGLALYK
jgi:hypothetical protein